MTQLSGTTIRCADEAAMVLGVRAETLLVWARSGKIGSFRPARGVYLFSDEHLMQYLRTTETPQILRDDQHAIEADTAKPEEEPGNSVLDKSVARRQQATTEQNVRTVRPGKRGACASALPRLAG